MSARLIRVEEVYRALPKDLMRIVFEYVPLSAYTYTKQYRVQQAMALYRNRFAGGGENTWEGELNDYVKTMLWLGPRADLCVKWDSDSKRIHIHTHPCWYCSA